MEGQGDHRFLKTFKIDFAIDRRGCSLPPPVSSPLNEESGMSFCEKTSRTEAQEYFQTQLSEAGTS